MADKFYQRGKSRLENISFLLLLTIGVLFCSILVVSGQTSKPKPTPTPAPAENNSVSFGNYEITSSIEVGVRGISVNGSDNKFKSDFNYRPGVRLFDSSFFVKGKEDQGGFDSLMVTSSGWDSDPSSFTRINMAKAGAYRFDANIRQVNYFNNLVTWVRNGHNADTKRNFGDFDLTLFPENENFRLRFGAGYNRDKGTGNITARAYSDEFSPVATIKTNASDFRASAEGKLAGFNLGLGYGYRKFDNKTSFAIIGSNPGYNTTNTTVYSTWNRFIPTKGETNYFNFHAQRTFAKKLDFTSRVIYSSTATKFNFSETTIARDSSNNFIDSDLTIAAGNAKRPQFRGDVGLTYLFNDNFRISETLSFDRFDVTGGNTIDQTVASRTSAGVARANQYPFSTYYRIEGFKRYVNTLEGDYQFNNSFGLHVGYRYSHRTIDQTGYNWTVRNTSGFVLVNNSSLTCPATVTSPNPVTICEEESNSTNALIAGFKAKPMKNWVIFGDVEHGTADNAFTRLANYNYTNLRLRTRANFNKVSVNFSVITKDNENPSTSSAPPANYPTGDYNANTKSRIFSASVDYSPIQKFTLSSGYTYQYLTSETDIVINTGTLVRGFSQFYIRDHNVFFDASAQPFKRVSFFASYHYDKDQGQGNRVAAGNNYIVSSYPFRLFTAESRIAIRLTKNIDWNVGYQYIGYRDSFPVNPLLWVYSPQDYHANLPYTSVRFYIGRGER
ncbi:MAG: hypothetical protein K1X72_03250 [Pyrinomonadaceae bacterium]|nr:hypothetical protein [Pyrinomonadaceae bacterium]